MSLRLKILVGVAAVVVLSGCGRRGPLEPPPGSPPQPRPAQAEPVKAQPPGSPGGLFRNTASKPEEPEAKPTNAPKRSTTFVLDPLL